MPVDQKFSERTEGPTPNGGIRSVANFLDAEMRPCLKAEAVHIEILEHDKDGVNIARTWLERPKDEA